jgi:hypothetical protein
MIGRGSRLDTGLDATMPRQLQLHSHGGAESPRSVPPLRGDATTKPTVAARSDSDSTESAPSSDGSDYRGAGPDTASARIPQLPHLSEGLSTHTQACKRGRDVFFLHSPTLCFLCLQGGWSVPCNLCASFFLLPWRGSRSVLLSVCPCLEQRVRPKATATKPCATDTFRPWRAIVSTWFSTASCSAGSV